jgi:opacity protein-like surface antigen
MNALALLLILAGGPGDFEEDRLPRSLSESFDLPVEAPAEAGHAVFVGVHFGSADAVDGKSPAFLGGFEWRIHILPWLGAAGGVDYQAREELGNNSGIHYLQVPIMWSVLLYPPLPLGAFRPYGQAGIGLTITDISGSPNRDTTDVNLLYFAGLGVEIDLGSQVLVDANVRYVWAKDPPGVAGFSADWKQFTVGILFKLPH